MDATGVLGAVVVVVALATAWIIDRRRASRPLPPVDFSPELRRQILERARRRCEYCGDRIGDQPGRFEFRRPYECDHIKPKAIGGLGTLDNGAASCITCNKMKWQRSQEEFERLFVAKHGHRPGIPIAARR